MAANKKTVMFGAVGGMTVGNVVPFLWGDYNSFDLTNLGFTVLGGFLGIWLAYQLSKRFDL